MITKSAETSGRLLQRDDSHLEVRLLVEAGILVGDQSDHSGGKDMVLLRLQSRHAVDDYRRRCCHRLPLTQHKRKSSVREFVITTRRFEFAYYFIVYFCLCRDAKFRLGIMTLMSMSVILLAVVEGMPKFDYKSSETPPEEGSNVTVSCRKNFSGIPLIGACSYFVFL